MKVKIKEIKKKKGLFKVVRSGLGIAIVGNPYDVPAYMVLPIVKPILKWKKQRGDAAGAVSLTFSSIPDMHRPIEAALFQLYRREPELQRVIDRLKTLTVTLCDEIGAPLKSYDVDLVGLLQNRYRPLPPQPRPDPAAAKPAPSQSQSPTALPGPAQAPTAPPVPQKSGPAKT